MATHRAGFTNRFGRLKPEASEKKGTSSPTTKTFFIWKSTIWVFIKVELNLIIDHQGFIDQIL